MSGLKINVEKTKAIWIGSLSYSNRQIWTQGPFKVLGETFTAEIYNIWNVDTNGVLTKIENICNQWSKRKLT